MGDQSHLEKMGRELKCPICLSLLNSAVSLTCNHVFCNSCIMKSMKSVSDCPVCKVPFRRREVRAAPHMDSLVGIYKSMEAASGFQIFVTQNPSSTKLSDEIKQADGDKICGREDTDRVCQDRVENQRLSGRKGARKTIQPNLAVSDPAKPSFPTKKRVQVPQCLLSETPTRPEKLESRSGENIEDRSKDSSLVRKEISGLDRKVEHGLSPFFWLRDDEDIQRLTQEADGSHLLEVTPPYVPTFSDMKDSDDGSPSKLSLPVQSGGKSNDADFFDSEMFEWTQRPCSPELFSSPSKNDNVGEPDEIQESKEAPIPGSNTNNQSNEKEKLFSTEHEIIIEDEQLHPSSPSRAKSTDRRTTSDKSNKRGRTTTRTTLKKCLKKDAGQDPSFNLKKKSRKVMQEEAHCSTSISLKIKENMSEKAGASGTGSHLGIASSISHRVEIPKLKDKMDGKLPTSLGKKRSGTEDLGDRIDQNIAEKVGTNCQIDVPLTLKKQKLTSTNSSIAEEMYAVKNQMDEHSTPSEVGGKKISNTKQKRLKQGKESHSVLRSKSKEGLRNQKNVKVSFHGTSEDELSNVQQEIHSNLGAKGSKFTGKVLNVHAKETKSTDKIERSFGSRICGNSVILGQLDQSEVALRACQTITHMIQCAFCHSSEDTEASGEMVHYSNGRPVAANFNGVKVIHAHRNCAEWAPNVYFEDDIAINLEAELARSKKITCCCCGIKGAALGCYERSCRKSFHISCAKMTPQCRWDTDNFVMLCPLHASCKLPNEDSDSQERKRKKCIQKKKKTQQSNQLVSKCDSSANPSWNSHEKMDKLVLCCSALTVEEREFVSQLQRSSGIKVLKNWDLSVTHVIASTDENGAGRRTLKFLMGILEGKWILNIEWVKACMKAMKLVQEEQYEIKVDVYGVKSGPQLGRLRILNKQPKVFEGLKFYLMRDFPDSYKGYIQDIIVAGGGAILHRKPIYGVQGASPLGSSAHPAFIIYSIELSDKCDLSKKDMILNQRRADAEALAGATGAKAASNSWVLNSVAACKLQSY
ncbi:protein BREAST CANCER SUSCEPTIBILITY 1 homolog isoform X2 [Euphorbia lathyris]|uniref:protein BREAST CANCER SUSCEPTIBILITY 1 homolog isoform X2 n=1 Tax=Euphorbia lathyris TaxID=212925 RepID=UPI0033131BE6